MRPILAILLAASASQAATIMLHWDAPIDGPDPLNTYRAYHSTNVAIPMLQWELIATIPGDRTNSEPFDVIPGQHFFVLTASNIWSQSVITNFSNVARTPYVLGPFMVDVRKGP